MRTVTLAVFILASAASAEEASWDVPLGSGYRQGPPPVHSMSDDATVGLVPGSPAVSPVSVTEHRFSHLPLTDWSDDALVYPGTVGSGQDFDIDEDTGEIYAIFDTDHSTNDSCYVYRSQDQGATWSFWQASHNPVGTMTDPRVRVVKDSSGQAWVCMFFIVDGTLMMRRVRTDQSAGFWETVTADAVMYYDVDGEVGTGGWVYVTYIPTGTGYDIRFARNALSGAGWQDDQFLFIDPEVHPYPSIAAAAGGVLGIAFIDDRLTTFQQVRFRSSSDYGSTWSASIQISNNLGVPLRETAIACSHGSPATMWVFLTYTSGGQDVLTFRYSTNGGANWNPGGLIAGGTGDKNMPDIRANKTAPQAVNLAFIMDSGDSIMVCGTTVSDPANFTTPIRVNDYQATDLWAPTAGFAHFLSTAVLYTSSAMGYSLYWDWWGNVSIEVEAPGIATGVSCSPNPFTNMTSVSFSVEGTDPVSVSVYSITGRLVRSLVEGQCLSPGGHAVQWDGRDGSGSPVVPGVYLCRLSSGGSIATARMVMVAH